MIVAMGASAGGVEALTVVMSALPRGLPAAVIVVLHLSPHHESLLPTLLARRSDLRVRAARDGEVLEDGTAYVAPPDAHLLVRDDHLVLTHTPLVNYCRPSVDLLLESLAEEHGHDVLAVILTGSGIDGAAGVRAVKQDGGTVICEDPRSAAHSGMPAAAVATGCVDRVLPLAQIGQAIVDTVATAEKP
jgi:two-component system, chemotaxis family, protein-glutamate methylesterase/glutaminase